MRSMAEIQPGNVHSFLNKRVNLLGSPGRWAQSADDLNFSSREHERVLPFLAGLRNSRGEVVLFPYSELRSVQYAAHKVDPVHPSEDALYAPALESLAGRKS